MGFFSTIAGVADPTQNITSYEDFAARANGRDNTAGESFNDYENYQSMRGQEQAFKNLTMSNDPEFEKVVADYYRKRDNLYRQTVANKNSPTGRSPRQMTMDERKALIKPVEDYMTAKNFTPLQREEVGNLLVGVAKTGGDIFTQFGRIGQAITNNPVFPAALAAFGIPAALGSAGAAGAAGATAGAASGTAAGAGTGLGALATSALGATGAGAGTGIGASALGALGGLSGAGAAGFGTAGTAGLGASALGALGGLTGTAGGGGIGASALGALGAASAAPTLLGSSTLAGLASSLGLGGLVEGAPNVLGSLGLSGGGSTALGSGVLNNLLGGGGQAGGAGGSSLLQDLLFGGGTLASGIYGADTAKDAAKLQAEAVDKALGSIQTGYNTGRADLQPYYSTGTKSLAEIANLQGQNGRQQQQEAFNRFTVSPDYQFRFGEGQKALQNTAAAKGSLYSGNTAKALTDYGQGMASQEYGNYYNRLNDTTKQGALTAGTLANLSTDYFGNQADLLRTKGDAIASGKVAGANAYQSTLQNLGQYLTAPQYKGLF